MSTDKEIQAYLDKRERERQRTAALPPPPESGASETTSRGFRNNNFGNIRHSDNQWQGMSHAQNDNSFVQFDTPQAGLRAMGTVLNTYKNKHGLDTVEGIINRYAPPSDNNPTDQYAANVAKAIGVARDAPLTDAQMPALMAAMTRQENGTAGNLTHADFQQGWNNVGKDLLKPKQQTRQNSFSAPPPVSAPTAAQPPKRSTDKEIQKYLDNRDASRSTDEEITQFLENRDAGRIKTAASSFASGLGQVISSVPKALNEGVFHALNAATGQRKDPTQGDLYKLGEGIQEFFDSGAKNPKYQDEFFASQLPQGLGTTAGFLVGGIAGAGSKVLGATLSAALGSSTMAVDQSEDARRHGADIETQAKAFLSGAGIGTTEALPIMRALRRLDGGTGIVSKTLSKALAKLGQKGGRIVGEGLTGAVEEALQETVQNASSNAIAQALYDADRELLEGVGEGAQVGGAVGFLMNTMMAALGGKRSGINSGSATQDDTTPVEDGVQPATEAQPEADVLPDLPKGPAAGAAQTLEQQAAEMEALKANLTDDPVEAAPEEVEAEPVEAEKPAGEAVSSIPNIESTKKTIVVEGDPKELRAVLKAAGIKAAGRITKTGLAFNKKLEQQIKAAFATKAKEQEKQAAQPVAEAKPEKPAKVKAKPKKPAEKAPETAETPKAVAAPQIEVTKNGIVVHGDTKALRKQLKEGGLEFPGSTLPDGLGFAKKLEPRIRSILEGKPEPEPKTIQPEPVIENVPAVKDLEREQVSAELDQINPDNLPLESLSDATKTRMDELKNRAVELDDKATFTDRGMSGPEDLKEYNSLVTKLRRRGIKPTRTETITELRDQLAAQKPKDPRVVDPDKDTAIKVLQRKGGLNRELAEAEGTDPAEFKVRRGNQPLYPREGGMSLDGARELLIEEGFLPEGASVEDARDVIDRGLSGDDTYHPNGLNNQLEREAAQHEEDLKAQGIVDALDPDTDTQAAPLVEHGDKYQDLPATPEHHLTGELMGTAIGAGMHQEELQQIVDDANGDLKQAAAIITARIKELENAETKPANDGNRNADGDSTPLSQNKNAREEQSTESSQASTETGEEFGLDSQSEKSLQQDAEKLAETKEAEKKAKAKADRKAKKKADADNVREDFGLTGSQRTEDALPERQSDLVDDQETDQQDDTGDTRASRKGGKGGKRTVAQTQAAVDEITAEWEGSPPIEVVESVDELPKEVIGYLRKSNAEGEVDGIFHEGVMYVINDQIESDEQLSRVLFHEAEHLGLRKLFGAKFVKAMNNLTRAMGGQKGILAYAKKHGIDLSAYKTDVDGRAIPQAERDAILVEELLAHMAENGGKGIKTKALEVLGAIRNWLRTNGFAKLAKLRDSDLALLIKQGRETVTKDSLNKPTKGTRLHRVFHGTPNDFDEFSTAHIGTGEGRQAFGWGLYFADKKSVGEFYRESLGRRNLGGDTAAKGTLYRYFEDAEFNDKTKAQAIKEFARRKEFAKKKSPANVGFIAKMDLAIQLLESGYNPKKTGNLLEVELAPKEDEYLDWDKPLNEQPEMLKKIQKILAIPYEESSLFKQLTERGHTAETIEASREAYDQRLSLLKDALQDFELGSTRGDTVYRIVTDIAGSNRKEASLLLKSLGIPGIRYLDGDSRNAGEGANNYVIFDGADAQITTRLSRKRVKASDSVEAIAKKNIAIGDENLTLVGKAKKLWETHFNRERGYYKQHVFDDQWAKAELEIEKYGKELDASISPSKQARMARNLPGMISVMMKHGALALKDGAYQVVKGRKGLVNVFEPLRTHDDGDLLDLWQTWAAANRAKRLIKETNPDGTPREKQWTQTEIDTTLKELNGKYGELFKGIQKDWREFNKQVLDMAQESGVINAKERAKWEQNDYVPFYRAIETASGDEVLGPNGENPIKRLTGKAERSNDIYENIMMNTASLMHAALNNRSRQGVIALAQELGYATRAKKTLKPVHLTNYQLARALEQARIIVSPDGLSDTEEGATPYAIKQVERMAEKERNEWQTLFQRVAPTGDNIVSVMVDGKQWYYEINDNPLLLESMNLSETVEHTAVLTAMSTAKHLLTTGVTRTPEFMLANTMRDTLTAWLATSEVDWRHFVRLFKSMREIWTRSGTYLDIMAAGGTGGGFYEGNQENLRKMLEEKLPKGEVGKFMKTILTPKSANSLLAKGWEVWGRAGEVSENMNRVAIAQHILEEGGTMAEAAYQSQDLLNFTRHGSAIAMRKLIKSVAFMNARLQGADRLWRGYKDHPGKFLFKGAGLVAPSIVLALINWDDDDYNALPDWDKDTYWHFAPGTDHHIRLPKPFEGGLIFATMPERLLRGLFHEDEDMGLFAARMGAGLWDTLAMNPMPQLLKPVSEQYSNKSSFTGAPIVGRSLETLEGNKQFTPWTSETLRAIADAMPEGMSDSLRSPKRMEHLIRGVFGGLGTYALALSDGLVRPLGDFPARADTGPRNWPVVQRFWRNQVPRSTKYVNEVHELLNEAQKMSTTINELRRQGLPEEAKKLMENNQAKLNSRRAIRRIRDRMSKVSKRMKAIEFNRTMGSDEKKQKLKVLRAKRNEIAEQIKPYIGLF